MKVTEPLKRAGRWFTAKKIKKFDLFCILAAAICLSVLIRSGNHFDSRLSRTIAVESPWLVKADDLGTIYAVDQEKTRILKISNGKVRQSIYGTAPFGTTFSYAENICIAENGDLFVHDTGWNEDGFSLAYESILRFDAGGRLLGSCYRADYQEQYHDKHRIFGMTTTADQLYFVQADEFGFSLNSIDLTDQTGSTIATFQMAEAITLIQDFVIDPGRLDVYVIDKRGRLYHSPAGDERVTKVYDADADKTLADGQKVALYRGAMGPNGTIYVMDIASGQLLRFRPDQGYRREEVLGGTQMWNVSYQELQKDQKALLTYVADGSICTAAVDGTVISAADQYLKSTAYQLRELLFDLLAVIVLVLVLYLGIRGLSVILTLSYTNIQKIGALVIVTVVVVSTILMYGLMGQFKGVYREELLTKLSMTAQIVSNNIEAGQLDQIEMPQGYMNASYQELWKTLDRILDKDYPYSQDIYCNILRYDGQTGYAVIYLDNSIGTYYPLTAEETEAVKVVYEQGVLLQSDIRSETGAYIYVMTPVLGAGNQVHGVVSVGTLSSVIDGKIDKMTKDIMIAMIMIILVIMFLFSEVLSFFDLKEKHQSGRPEQALPVPMHMVRLTIFITFLAFNMATSFLPVYIMNFVHEDLGIPPVLANSLPITLNLVFVGLTSLFCPRLIGKAGFARLAAFSGMIALCGDLLMAASVNYLMIVAGLILNGIGVGLITNSIHIFIASVSKQNNSEEGFSIFNAASISGINCGMLFGSALAERLGQHLVFFLSAAAWGLVTIVFLLVGKQFVLAKAQSLKTRGRKQSMAHFLLSPAIWKFMICIQIPYIVMNSFTYYYVPIYGSENGLTEKVVSLLIIACSLCSVYLSVPVTNYFSRRWKDKAIYLSSLITFLGLLLFAWNMSLPFLLLALLLIGLANSFGASTRISYFIRMKEAEAYGEERAMGAYNFVDNLGESTGSMIFAGIISVGFQKGILMLIGCVGGLHMIYGCSGQKRKKKQEIDKGGSG